MPELLHPGVYVQEVPSAVRPIEGVSTSTAAFIGVTDKGPIPGGILGSTSSTNGKLPTGKPARPLMVTSFTEYQRQFGSFRKDSFLTYAARAFFDNGGKRLYVVRVADSAAALASATVAPSIALAAHLPGKWASLLWITITNADNGDPTNFNLIVNAVSQGGLVQLQKIPNLTLANAATTISTQSPQFIDLQSLTTRPANSSGIMLAGGADGTGGGPAHVTTTGTKGILVEALYPGTWANNNLTVRVAGATNAAPDGFDLIVKFNGVQVERFTNLAFRGTSVPPNYARTIVNANSRYITLPNDFTARPDNDAADQPLTGGIDGTGSTPAAGPANLSVKAANEGAWGNDISVQITDSSDRDPNNFKLVVWYGGTAVETFDRLTYQGSPTTLATAVNVAEYGRVVVNERSDYIAIDQDFASKPTNTPTLPTTPPIPQPFPLTGGVDSGVPTTSAYIGAPATDNTITGTGLYALDKITDVNLIAIPGQGDPQTVNAGMEYCKTRPLQDCFFIADVGAITNAPSARLDDAATNVVKLSDARDFATGGFNGMPLDKAAGDYGAIYYPWVWAADPIGTGNNPRILLPPSGFLAGIYARIDNSRGVFKAPAGTEAGVFGALDVATTVSDTEQDELNPISVNVIRTVPGSGIVVWGTRTIGSDASWRYIPVRRMAIFLRVSIYYGIQWAVFEPNDEPLWASLRLNIRAFMLTQFRAGAFQGSKPDDAFFVKCDSTTTTQTDIDNGVVNILVGFAPLKPAEFVVLKLSQKVNQPAS